MIALRPELLPQDGGQRNASRDFSVFPLDVGSYPDQRSPWGLLNLAGGEWEWLEDFTGGSSHRRAVGGSWFQDLIYNEPYSEFVTDFDHVTLFEANPVLIPSGVRLASNAFHPADLNTDGRLDFFDVSVFIFDVHRRGCAG